MSDPFNTTMAIPPQESSGGFGTTGPAPSSDNLADKANEVKDVARERASDVTDKASDAAAAGKQAISDVAQTATESAQQVAEEAARQARDLVGEAKSQLSQQADDQHRKVITGLRSLSDELQSMARNSEQSGLATELVSQAQTRVRDVADWLDGREPGDLLQEVRTFARRRPGTFLLGAALAGVAAGRMTRGVVTAHTDANSTTAESAASQTTAPGIGTAAGDPRSGVAAAPDRLDTQVLAYSSPPAAPPALGSYGGGGATP